MTSAITSQPSQHAGTGGLTVKRPTFDSGGEFIAYPLSVSPELDAELNRLAAEAKIDVASVLVRAVAVYAAAKKAQKDGMAVGFAKEPDRLDTVLLNL